jgi:hypothetical protein
MTIISHRVEKDNIRFGSIIERTGRDLPRNAFRSRDTGGVSRRGRKMKPGAKIAVFRDQQ